MERISQETPIDLLLVCGDFQSIRDEADLENMCCPKKYRELGDFSKYFNKKLKPPPFPTVFIGGNHEASNFLQELHFGGFVCENIYFLGHSGVIKAKKNQMEIRIAGVSGIFNHKDFFRRNLENLPFSEDSKKSAYHCKEREILKLSLVSAVFTKEISFFAGARENTRVPQP